MTQTVELPLWVIIVASVLAAIAITDRLLSPAVRWFFRRRVNRAIDELNTRLQLKIRSFGTTRRDVLIDRVTNDPQVVNAVAAYSRESGTPMEVVIARATRYAREIVPCVQRLRLFSHRNSACPDTCDRAVPRQVGLHQHRRAVQGCAQFFRRVCHEPPVEYGLCVGDLSRIIFDGTVLCCRRMGSPSGAANHYPFHGRLLYQAQCPQSPISPSSRDLCADGNRGRRHPGGFS
jgi:hypothetical protein